jgi:hypothetical protein
MKELDALAEDMLLNASDYIGNNPEQFDADNNAIGCIKNNEAFREYVSEEVSSYPEEYDDLSQEEAARFVWDMYLGWAY